MSAFSKLQATSLKFQEILLAKPLTFMNKSGDAVKAIIDRQVSNFKFQVSKDLIVVHDDLDIPFGKFKIQTQGPKLHNGLTSIQNKLQTMDFLRVRIGVDNRPPENRMPGEEYVLQNFTEEERFQLPKLFKAIDARFKAFLQPI
jgi:PTH1 family peptidyl-tRNA hydrolase